MALLLSELYDALKEANVSDETARKAAEAVAAYESRFQKIETEVRVLKWMVGSHIAISLLGFSLLANWMLQLFQRLPRP